MAFDDARYLKLIQEDSVLIEALNEHEDELTYAKGRVQGLRELQEEMAAAVEKQSAKRAAKAEAARSRYVNQTRFLLMADYISDLTRINDFFPPPEE